MAEVALVVEGVVAQVAAEAFPVADAFVWVDISGIDPSPQPGWTAAAAGDAWTFTAPEPPPPPPLVTEITAGQFLLRWQATEQSALIAVLGQSPVIVAGLIRGLAHGVIDLAAPETVEWMTAAVAANVITQDRATEILTP